MTRSIAKTIETIWLASVGIITEQPKKQTKAPHFFLAEEKKTVWG
jgi:hypothetical protein